MHKRIVYTCKKCGWSGSIVSAWSDIKPKRCPNKKCKTSFLKNPSELVIDTPKESKGDL